MVVGECVGIWFGVDFDMLCVNLYCWFELYCVGIDEQVYVIFQFVKFSYEWCKLVGVVVQVEFVIGGDLFVVVWYQGDLGWVDFFG